MQYHEFPTPEHPAKRERPRDIARINVLKAEWADMKAVLTTYGPCEIIDCQQFPIVSGWFIEVLCSDPITAQSVMDAWNDYVQTSPYRS
jgi:hypothetical protein